MKNCTVALGFAVVVASSAFTQEALRNEPLVSPRLLRLQGELDAGELGSLERFWKEIESQGAPLVESISGEDENALVTFLWRGQKETRNVLVHSWFGNNNKLYSHDEDPIHDNLMTRLRETDVWHKSYRVPHDARTIYRLAANHSLLKWRDVPPSQMAKHMSAYGPDPLNPRSYVIPGHDLWQGIDDVTCSVVQLPGAPPQPWIKALASVPKGEVKLHRVTSRVLGNRRRVWVYTPPSYKPSDKPYHVLVLFDGWHYIRTMPTPTILDNLIAKRSLPPVVAVMVDEPTAKDRFLHLGCYPPFNDFLVSELIPWLRREYRVTNEPGKTIVGGLSRGGLAAAYAALEHPEIFGNVISQSGGFSWPSEDNDDTSDRKYGWLIRQYVSSTIRPVRFYLEAGLYEDCIYENRHMRDVLQAKGHDVHYSEFSGGHDFSVWQGTLGNALQVLLGKQETNGGANRK